MVSHAVNINSNCIESLTRKSNETKWKILETEEYITKILPAAARLLRSWV